MSELKMNTYLKMITADFNQSTTKLANLDKYNGFNLVDLYESICKIINKKNGSIPSDSFKKSMQEINGTITMSKEYVINQCHFSDKFMAQMLQFPFLLNEYTDKYLKSMHLFRKSIHDSNQLVLTDAGYKLYMYPKVYLDKFFRKNSFDYHPYIPLSDILLPIVHMFRLIIQEPKYLDCAGLVFINHIFSLKTYERFTTTIDDYGHKDVGASTLEPISYLSIIIAFIDSFIYYLRFPSEDICITGDYSNYMMKLIKLDKMMNNMFKDNTNDKKKKSQTTKSNHKSKK